MKIYGNSPSPFVRHCRIALIESGLDFEFLIDTDYQLSQQRSPTQKIPFLEYEENGKNKILTDSTSILRYVREKSGQDFLPTVEELNDFCTVNTLIDAQVNIFLLKKEGLTADNVNYLKRQENRIQTGLGEFEEMTFSEQAPWSDVEIRLACFLDWVRFRKHFSLDAFPKLLALLTRFDEYQPFIETTIVDV
jgi:glutathione S-transferase